MAAVGRCGGRLPFDSELFGIVAGTLTTVSFLPQVVKVYRTRRADDISLAMFVTFCVGVALWVVYGIRIRALSVILANAVTLCLAVAILVGKVRFSRHGAPTTATAAVVPAPSPRPSEPDA